MTSAPVAWPFLPDAVRETPGSRLTIELSHVTLKKNWLANFENTKLVKRFRRSGRGRIDGARKGNYGRRSAFDYCNGGGHDDAACREGRIGGHCRATSVAQAGRVKTVKSTMYFGCPVWFVNWTEKPFWPPQYRLP